MKLPFSNRPRKDLAMAGIFLAVCLMLVSSAMWAYTSFMKSPPYVDPERYPIRGFDVSAHNGDVDMDKAAECGVEFVFIKASEGGDFQDRKFRRNFENAKKAGLKVGIYHFFRFDRDGVEQALNFMRTAGHRRPDLGFAIDIEKAGNPDSIPSDSVVKRLTNMVDYLNLLGHRVLFYSNREGYYEYLADNFPGQPLWICGFSQNPVNAEWTFWQFDHHGKLDGIKGNVDLNAFCGNRREWDNFLSGGLWPYSEQ